MQNGRERPGQSPAPLPRRHILGVTKLIEWLARLGQKRGNRSISGTLSISPTQQLFLHHSTMLPYLRDLLPPEGAPETLYRIYDNETFNKRRSEGFLAGDCTPFDMHDALAVHYAVKSHLNWHNRSVLTPFISTSDSSGWTRANSIKREQNGNGNVKVAEISTALVGNVPVYSMQTLADAAGVTVYHPCDHEWVFLGRIPRRAIIAEYDVADFETNYPEWLGGYSLRELGFLDSTQQEIEGG